MKLENEVDKIINKIKADSQFHVSSRLERVLNDVNQAEKEKNSYAYLYLSQEFELIVVLLIAFRTLLKNMLDDGTVDPNNLKLDDKLLYAPPSDGKTSSVLFKGSRKDPNGNLRYILKYTNKRGPNAGLEIDLLLEAFKRDISIADEVSTRKKKDFRNELAKDLGLKNFSRTDSNKIFVLLEKDVLDRIEELDLPINGKRLNFGSLFSSQILKSTGNFSKLRHTSRIDQPFITFVTNLDILEEYLADSSTVVDDLYIIGDKWWRYHYEFRRESMLELVERKNTMLHVFSTVTAMMSPSNLEALKNLDAVYAWFFDDAFFKTLSCKTEFVPVENELLKAYQDTEFAIDQGLDDLMVIWLKLFRHTLFSTIIPASRSKVLQELFDQLINKLELADIQFDLQEKLQADIEVIKQCNYPILLDNRLDYSPNTLIVTSKQNSSEIAKYMRLRNKSVVVLDYKEKITPNLYNQFEKLILINPHAFEKRKWLLAGLAPEIELLYPEMLKEKTKRSLVNDRYFINEISSLDWFKDGSSSYLTTALEHAHEEIKKAAVDQEIDLEEKIEREEETEKQYYYHAESGKLVDDTTEEVVDYNDNVNAIVKNELSFQNSNAVVLGTEHGQILIRNTAGRLKHVPISSVVSRDVVGYMSNDAIVKYRKEFRKMSSDANFRAKKIAKDPIRQRDYYWKRKFLNFVSQENKNVEKLQTQFLNFGYKRSTGFFSDWMNVEKIHFVPEDLEFVKIIGQIISDSSLINEAEKYYDASKKVKEIFLLERQEELDKVENATEDEIEFPISYLTVKNNKSVNCEVKRIQTNCLIENKKELLQ